MTLLGWQYVIKEKWVSYRWLKDNVHICYLWNMKIWLAHDQEQIFSSCDSVPHPIDTVTQPLLPSDTGRYFAQNYLFYIGFPNYYQHWLPQRWKRIQLENIILSQRKEFLSTKQKAFIQCNVDYYKLENHGGHIKHNYFNKIHVFSNKRCYYSLMIKLLNF